MFMAITAMCAVVCTRKKTRENTAAVRVTSKNIIY